MASTKLKGLARVFTSNVGVIRPTNFHINPEAVADNKFIDATSTLCAETATMAAQAEFSNFVKTLSFYGINPRIFEQENPRAVDAIFPDWFFTIKNPDIPGGVLISGSMFHPMRRLEYNENIIRELKDEYAHFIDLS